MSLKDLDQHLTSALAKDTPDLVAPQRPRRSMPAPAALLSFASEMEEATNKIGKPMRVRIDQCSDGDMHPTPVDQARVDELIPNIRSNGQTTPALVRVREVGRYEILAGRHRKYAMLALGETEWDIIIKELDDDSAERLAFYENLLAPNLTDYARYKGFQRRRDSRGMTIDQLSEESGVARTTIGRLLRFSALPSGSEEYIARRPDLFGAALVEQISSYVETHAERVLEAIQLIASGNMEGKDAIKFITQPQAPKRAEVRTQMIKFGKRQFAKMASRGQQVTVTVADPQDMPAIEKAIEEVLRQRSKEKSSKSD